ncbi:MAG: hypothetical protein JRI71_10135 [Deltaproteobacteria bacterium]|nr:hypothetical protein [Deltaproteobacteria bacterium]
MIKEQVVQIIVDHRESRSGLIDELTGYHYETTTHRVSTNVETATLEVGDIICSDRVGIERKSCDDFVDTIISPERNMPRQLADLSRTFERPVVILEGDTIYGLRGIHPEALRAQVAMVCIGFGVPMIPTKSVEETAAQVVTIARREQFRENRKISIPHTKRTLMTLPQRQEYVVSSIGGGIGATMAETLLKHFGSVQGVINASIDELVCVEGVGKVTAENIHAITRSEYKA